MICSRPHRLAATEKMLSHIDGVTADVVNIIIDDMSLDTVDIYRTKVDAHMWHRRMDHM